MQEATAKGHPSTAGHAATKDRSSVGPVDQGGTDVESVAALVDGRAAVASLAVASEGGGWPLARDERN